MAKFKKCFMLLGLAFFSLFGMFFAGCESAYKNVDIELGQTQVFLATTQTSTLKEEQTVSATINGVKSKSISKKLAFISDKPEVVRVDGVEYADGTTSAKLIAVGGGTATVYVISEGNVRKQIEVNVLQEATSIGVYGSYAPIILRGASEFKFDESQIFFNPTSVTNKDVQIELWSVNENGAPIHKIKNNAKVLSQADISQLTNSAYVFKIIKSTTAQASTPVVAWQRVVVKNSLEANLINIVSEQLVDGTLKLSTSNLGDASLLPAATDFVVQYNSSFDLTGLVANVKINNPELFSVSSELMNGSGYLAREVYAIKKGEGSFDVELFYEGFELSKIKKTFPVSVIEYPSQVNAYFNGKLNSENTSSIYATMDGYNGMILSFNTAPVVSGVATTLKLSITAESFAILKKDEGESNVISGVTFDWDGTSASYVAEILSSQTLTIFAADEAELNSLAEIVVSIVSAQDEGGTVLFENKNFDAQTISLTVGIPVTDVSLSYQSEELIVYINGWDSEANYLQLNNGIFVFDVASTPVGANLNDLEFLISSQYSYESSLAGAKVVVNTFFNSSNNTYTVVVNGRGYFYLTIKNDFIEKKYFISVYRAVENFELDIENAIYGEGCFYDESSGLFYVARDQKIHIPYIVEPNYAGRGYLYSGGGYQYNTICGVDSGRLRYSIPTVYFGHEAGASFNPNLICRVDFYVQYGGNTNRGSLRQEVRFKIYEPMRQSDVAFKNEADEIVETVNLNYAGDVGYYGNTSATLTLDVGSAKNVTYNFAKSSSAFGTLEQINNNTIKFTANSWSGNSDVASVIIVGQATQYSKTSTVRLLVNITRKPHANAIAFVNESDVYATEEKTIPLDVVISPTLASNDEVVYVITGQEKVSGENYYNVIATTLGETVDITSLTLSNTELTVKAAGKYRVWALYKNSVRENISETLSESVISESVCTFKDVVFANGTEELPYRIYNATDFEAISNSSQAYFELQNNIDLSSVTRTLGDFAGTLNGNGFEIYGFNIKQSSENLGLFQTVSGTIRNLKVRGSVRQGVFANSNTGILAGVLTGTLENVSIISGDVGFYNKNLVIDVQTTPLQSYSISGATRYGFELPLGISSLTISATLKAGSSHIFNRDIQICYYTTYWRTVSNSYFSPSNAYTPKVINGLDPTIKYHVICNTTSTLSYVKDLFNKYNWQIEEGEVATAYVAPTAAADETDFVGALVGSVNGAQETSAQIINCTVENFTTSNVADAVVGGFAGFAKNANLSGRYLGEFSVLGEEDENVVNNVLVGNSYSNAAISADIKSENSNFIEFEEKIYYKIGMNESFRIEQLFNVASTANLMFDGATVAACNVPFNVALGGDNINFDGANYWVNNYGICDFTFKSSKDENVKQTISVFFIPNNISITTNVQSLLLHAGQSQKVEASSSVSNLNSFEFEVETTNASFVLDHNAENNTISGDVTLLSASNGSVTFKLYADFNGTKYLIKSKTINISLNTSATAITATISQAQFNPTESILVNINIEKDGEADSVLIGENVNSLQQLNTESSYSGLKFFSTGVSGEFRVYIDETNFEYGEHTLYFAPGSNTNLITQISFTIIRPTIALVEIDQFMQIGSTPNGQLNLNNSVIDRNFININESSLFGVYMSPEMADVEFVEILSNNLQFEHLRIQEDKNTFESALYTSVQGGILINSNPFIDGWLYVRSILGNVPVGTNVSFVVNIHYINASGAADVKSKQIVLSAQNRENLQIVVDKSTVAEGCEFTAKLYFANELLVGEDFNTALQNLSYDVNNIIEVVRTNSNAGEITFRTLKIGNCELQTSFSKTKFGVTKTFQANISIKVVDMVISGFEYYLNYGTISEQKVDDVLEVTAYNNFNVGVKFVGMWREGLTGLISQMEQKLNNFEFMSVNDVSTFFVDENGSGLVQNTNYPYFKVNGTTEVGAIKMLKLLPTLQTQQTLINLKLNACYSENKLYILANENYIIGINGTQEASSISNFENIEISGRLNVKIKQNSSEDCPLPISSMEDLLINNVEGANLILTNDIYVYNHTPIEAKFKTLDGNGYKIVLYSTAFGEFLNTTVIDDTLNIGLFSSITENAMVKNLTVALYANQTAYTDLNGNTIEVAGGLKININREIDSNVSINYGTLAAINNGIISNCQVVYIDTPKASANDVYDDVLFNPSLAKTNANHKVDGKIAGLVAINNAYITNSNVQVDVSIGTTTKAVTGDYLLAGLVGRNENDAVISSCFVKNSSLYNHSENTEGGSVATAGFVGNNASNANIIYSYVHGGFNYNLMSSVGSEITADDYIRSNYKQIKTNVGSIAGFVFQNDGKISNSFSNVDLYQISTTTTAGFAFSNQGTIEMSYSASHLAEEAGNNTYGFVKENLSLIQNCYFLDDGFSINAENSGVTALSSEQFTQQSSFVGYGFETEFNAENAIWTMPNKVVYRSANASTTGAIKAKVAHVGEGKGNYGLTTNGVYYYRGENNGTFSIMPTNETSNIIHVIALNVTAPDLVVTNLATSSRRILEGAVNENGEFIENENLADEDLNINNFYYSYDVENFFDLGTKNNPILIRDVSEFNSFLVNGSTTYGKWGNDYYYRLVSNLQFNEQTALTPSTTTSVFYGVLDGNGMSLEGIKLNTTFSSQNINPNEINESLGLFGVIDGTAGVRRAGITERTNAGAGVRALNITISGLYANTYVYAGGLAGVVKNASIYSVAVSQVGGSQVIGYGRNIVGGVVGLAVGASDIYNISSNISLFSTYTQDSVKLINDPSLNGSGLEAMTINTSRYASKVNSDFYVGQSYMLNDLRVSYVGGTIGVLDTYYVNQYGQIESVNSESLFVNPKSTYSLFISGAVAGGSVGYVAENAVVRDAKINLQEAVGVSNLAENIAGGVIGENHGTVDAAQIVYPATNVERNIGYTYKNTTAIIIGGVVGLNDGGTVINSCETKINTLAVHQATNTGAYIIGGVVGLNISRANKVAAVQNCFNTTNITAGKQSVSLGGIVGFNVIIGENVQSKIENCYNTGKLVSLRNSSSVGGIVGKTWGGITEINQSFSAGKITVGIDSFAGGFVGWAQNLILSNVFTLSNISSGQNSLTASAIGAADGEAILQMSNAYLAGTTTDEQTNILFGAAFKETYLNNVMLVAEMYNNSLNLHESEITSGQIVPSSFPLLNNNLQGISTWKTDGNIPYLVFENYIDFVAAIENSETLFQNLTTINRGSLPTVFSGEMNYMLTENIELNAPIYANNWSGALIGNGNTITLRNGISMFANGLGNGARISGIKVIAPEVINVNGDFGFIACQTHGDVALSSIEISPCQVNVTASNVNVGALIGKASEADYLLLVDCASTAQIVEQTDVANNKIGGLVGSVDGNIEIYSSFVAADLTVASNSTNLGGIVGWQTASSGVLTDAVKISASFYAGQIQEAEEESISTTSNIGYFVGNASKTNIANSFVAADNNFSGNIPLANALTTNINLSYNYSGLQLSYWNEAGEVVEPEGWIEVKEFFKNNSLWNNDGLVPFVACANWETFEQKISNTSTPLKEKSISSLSELQGYGIYKLTSENLAINTSYDASNFKGIFNGNNKTINLTVPMFANLGPAVIMNLTLNGEINIATAAGSIVGTVNNSLHLIGITNNANITSNSGYSTGGLVGEVNIENGELMQFSLLVQDCHNYGNISSDSNVGGLIGYKYYYFTNSSVSIRFENCSNNSSVESNGFGVGGLVGYSSYYGENSTIQVIITDCTNNAEVKGDNETGGIIGHSEHILENSVLYEEISNCNNYADITSNSASTGGIVAYNQVEVLEESTFTQKIMNCENWGNITSDCQMGGIIGYNSDVFSRSGSLIDITYSDLYNYGAVKVKTESSDCWYVGGICSAIGCYLDDDAIANYNISNLVNSGEVCAYQAVGGVIGMLSYNMSSNAAKLTQNLNNLVNLGKVSGSNKIGGIIGYVLNENIFDETDVVTLENSFSAGTIEVLKSNAEAGGIIGSVENNQQNAQLSLVLNNLYSANKVMSIALTTQPIVESSSYITASNVFFAEINTNLVETPNAVGVNSSLESLNAKFAFAGGNWKVDGFVPYLEIGGVNSYDEFIEKYVLSNKNFATINVEEISTIAELSLISSNQNYILKNNLVLQNSIDAASFNGILYCNNNVITLTGKPMFSNLGSCTITGLKTAGIVTAFYDGSIAGSIAGGVSLYGCENNATITGSQITGGFFGYLSNAKMFSSIINCTNNAAIKGTDGSGGFIWLSNNRLLLNHCTNNGNVNTKNGNAGGFFSEIPYQGNGSSCIANCVNNGNVTSPNQYVGGIISNTGYVDLINCENFGEITSYGSNIGGIVGRVSGRFTIIDCNNHAKVSGNNRVGGIVGHVDIDMNSRIEDCLNEGTIEGNSNIGGITGYSFDVDLIDCANRGDVTGYNSYVGGIAGKMRSDHGLDVQNCINYGNVTGEQDVGGIAGSLESKINVTGCHNFGRIHAVNNVGGICGYATNSVNITNCISESEAIVQANSSYGQAPNLYDNVVYQGAFDLNQCIFVEDNVHIRTNYIQVEPNKSYIASCNSEVALIASICEFDADKIITGGIYFDDIIGGSFMQHRLSSNTRYIIVNLISVDGVSNLSAETVNLNNELDLTVKNLKDAVNVGGIVGYAKSNVKIENCINETDIAADGCVGGIAGCCEGCSITSCESIGGVAGLNCVGGIVGYVKTTMTIKYCVNNSVLYGDIFVGGIVGYASSNITLNGCTNNFEMGSPWSGEIPTVGMCEGTVTIL